MTTNTAILAGGQSRRMGTDKAALEIEGVSLLQRSVRAVRSAGQRVFIVGRSRPESWSVDYAVFVPDANPGLGPLGGVQTALEHAGTPTLVVACDLPLLTAEALRWLRGRYALRGTHGLITVNHGQWEPLFSIYEPSCLPLVAARLAENKRSLHGLIEAGEFGFAEAPEWVAEQLVNVNTPEDWGTLNARKRV